MREPCIGSTNRKSIYCYSKIEVASTRTILVHCWPTFSQDGGYESFSSIEGDMPLLDELI